MPVITALASVLGVVEVDRFGGAGEPVPVAGVVGPAKVALFEDVRELHGVTAGYRPFSTPVVLLGHGPVAAASAEARVASRAEDGTWSFDMAAYLELAGERTRCPEAPPGGAAYRQGPLISGRAGRAARWPRCR
ncbi:hypothetical protein GCM10007079_34890 [Nocardiopsis terrae]|uniref:Uncharacterized protein n=1 Tax=Nocardiopsis terrae TaxID=372655 RepID=A0ABR9HJW2_9ACTN|nr:hypothetical protein [Nocardiopsis terrae]MBE1459301.1 hypothetical protein [Nocardiopsis terrae]GHC89153.1 hypothetical protein GCM10007079_34890 [Nocardiopsis terrae]